MKNPDSVRASATKSCSVYVFYNEFFIVSIPAHKVHAPPPGRKRSVNSDEFTLKITFLFQYQPPRAD